MSMMVGRKKYLMVKGFTCSCFDLLHAGHIIMLEDAKAQCDKLIVGLQTDPTIDRPEKNKKDIKSTKEYCEEHERIYGSDCTPKWCEECGHLRIYEIIVTDKSRKITPKFDRRKRK